MFKAAHLESDKRLAFIVLIWSHSGGLSSNDGQLHVFDLQSDQQEVYAADNDVL